MPYSFPDEKHTSGEQQSQQERDSPDHSPHLSVKTTTNANGGGGLSDEEGEDSRLGGRSQSRIDKWKAKHEAMLRLAEDKTTASPRVNEQPEHEGSTEEHMDEDQNEKPDDKLPPIPDIEANGVCINLDEDLLPSKPLTRHGASVQQALSV